MRTLKEFWYETRTGRSSSSPDSFSDQEELSFCDLPIYGTDTSADGSSVKEYQTAPSSSSSSSSSNTEDEFFEFFTSRFNTMNSSQTQTTDGYFFCGKLIPSRRQPIDHIHIPSSRTDNIPKDLRSCSTKRQLLHWFSFPSSLSKICSSGENAAAEKSSHGVQRLSSCRRHLLGFGPMLFQQHGILEVTESNNRRCKKDRKSSEQPSSGWYAHTDGSRRGMLKSRSLAERGLSRLVGCLACQGYYHGIGGAVTETSTVLIPRPRV